MRIVPKKSEPFIYASILRFRRLISFDLPHRDLQRSFHYRPEPIIAKRQSANRKFAQSKKPRPVSRTSQCG